MSKNKNVCKEDRHKQIEKRNEANDKLSFLQNKQMLSVEDQIEMFADVLIDHYLKKHHAEK